MKKLTNMNLDVYLYLKDFEKENGYCPSYREIQEHTNYKSIASIKQAVDKLEEIKMIEVVRDGKGNVLGRTIRALDNKHTKEMIENLREEMN